MARIRSIKPEFWTSAQVAECSPIARLLFIGLWNFCDDAGRHQASAKRLKMEVFPGDSCGDSDVTAWISELIQNGLVIEYEAQGQSYWQVTGWHHQKIDKPTVRFPGPKEGRILRPLREDSASPLRMVGDSSPPEGNGRESKGEEGHIDLSMEIGRSPPRNEAVSIETTQGFVCRWKERIKSSDFGNLEKGNLFVDEAIGAGLSGESDRLRTLTLWHRMENRIRKGNLKSPAGLFLALWTRGEWDGTDAEEDVVRKWLLRRNRNGHAEILPELSGASLSTAVDDRGIGGAA